MTARSCGILALLAVAAGLVACSPSAPSLSLSSPGKIVRALSVVEDIGCTAQLLASGDDGDDGDDGDVVTLTSDDGVRFSGFLEAAPGRYTLELTFSGIPSGVPGAERRFLGRLISDTLTVVEGDVATPAFSTGLDTLGRDGDDGDSDGDGLGFLDELLLGSDPENADSDGDGVPDGQDCRPDAAANNTVIAENGSVDDCDGDGFISITPVFADSGNDCQDRDASINPGVEDDCDTLVDEDCNPSTCPVDDSVGPTIDVDVPADGTTAGCGLRIRVRLDDPSGVQSAFATWVDDPFDSAQRVSTLTERQDAPGLWESAPIVGIAGTGFRAGSHLLRITAFDGAGNSSNSELTFTLVTNAVSVSKTGPDVVEDTAASVRFTAQSDDGVARLVVFAAPPSVEFPTQFNLNDATVLDDVIPVSAETSLSLDVALDPAAFTERSAIYAVAEDSIGRLSSPNINAFASVTNGTVAAAACDGTFTSTVPATIVEPPPDAGDLVTFKDQLADATARALAIDNAAQLAAVFGLGLDENGAVDLGDASSFSKRWEFRFLKPDNHGITVRYLTPAFGANTPQVEPDVVEPLDDEPLANAGNTAAMQDSDALVALYESEGCGTFTGNDSDQFITVRSGAIDQVVLATPGGESLVVNAVTLAIIAPCN